MSKCLLNVAAYPFRFYYTIAGSIKDSMDVVFIIFVGQQSVFCFLCVPCMHRSLVVE